MTPTENMRPTPPITALRTIATFEAAKGVVAVVAGVGLLSLVHRDVQTAAQSLLQYAHFDPASRYARAFLDAAGQVSDGDLWMLATLAFLYAAIRAGEAYWLWNARPWAEWFALGSACFYLPAELYELSQSVTWLTVGVLAANLAIVAYLAWALRHDDTWSQLWSGARTPATRATAPSGNPT